MATKINGQTQKRATLAANTETIIMFGKTMQKVSLMSDGGTVYYKVDDVLIAITDLSANYLNAGDTADIYKSAPFSEIHVISGTATQIQWDMP